MRPRHIEACIARNPTKPGAAKLERAHSADVLLSDLEHRFVTLLRHHGLPRPRTNIARRRRSNHVAYTYGDVVERPAQTADEVGALLAACQLSA
jgi:hypothetical protein